MNGNSKPSGLSEQEFRTQHGYGFSTLYDAQLRQSLIAEGEPTRKIRDALAPTDRAAHDRALYGDNASAKFAAALDSEDLTRISTPPGRGRPACARPGTPTQIRTRSTRTSRES